MAASLIDLLNSEKALVDEINSIDKEVYHLQDKINVLVNRKRKVSTELASSRSCLAHYLEKNLIKYPNNDPFRNPEV